MLYHSSLCQYCHSGFKYKHKGDMTAAGGSNHPPGSGDVRAFGQDVQSHGKVCY